MPFPNIDPIAIQIGPVAIRWYALAYIAGIVLGWVYIRFLQKRKPLPNLGREALESMFTWAIIGIMAGGRLGYVLFYKPAHYLQHPVEIAYLWQGGMSFHGGLIGVILAFYLFARKYRIPFIALMDRIAAATPIGLFFGRMANFINGELYGRVTDHSFGMVFPHGGPLPRHPSQLYEAALEGIVLFCILWILIRFTRALNYPGIIAGLFLIGYAISRIIVEFFREPDAHLGFIVSHITMGQLLSLPMIGVGLTVMILGYCNRLK